MDMFNRKRIAAMDARIRCLESRFSTLVEFARPVSEGRLKAAISDADRILTPHQSLMVPDLDYEFQSGSVSLRALVLHIAAHLHLYVQLPASPKTPPAPEPAKLVSSSKAEA